MKKIKSITNITTIGELKKFLRGILDDIKFDENSFWFKHNVFDVEI